jgi:heptosyltransferase-2
MMQDTDSKILVWLPSPMGDAVLCTPALRAIRRHFDSAHITFFTNSVVAQVLSACNFNDAWITQRKNCPFAIAWQLKQNRFTHAILFKNSFVSALAVFMARIPLRIGYAREGRSVLLTEKLLPPKLPDGRFHPAPMIDYYLAIASWLGADTSERQMELSVEAAEKEKLLEKLPELKNSTGPVIILVPGGAFGPSKCWPGDRFAQTADQLIEKYNATVVISVAANDTEKRIASEISRHSKHQLINLAERPVSIGQLKALFSTADLVIANDTGPRHIAIALGRKIVTLFGPNDPAWTETDCENEIQIVGDAPCAPCARPTCKETEHLCMKSITADSVVDAAKKLLG